jgi:T5SS/PEP-CTERM-associated repeat protein
MIAGSTAFGASYYASGAIGNWEDEIWGVGNPSPGAGDTAYTNLGSTVTIDGTVEAVFQLHHASWSGNPDLVTLNIMNGGGLTVSDWSYLGVAAGDFGEVNVEAGSTYTALGPLNVGYNGDCVLNVNGGTVNASGGFFVPNPFEPSGTGSGTVNLISGAINVGDGAFSDFGMNASGLIDIQGGTLRIWGLFWDTALNGYITANQIVGWGGSSTVDISYDGDYTVLTSTHPYQPNPAIGEVVSAGPYTMTWVLPAPADAGGTVTCDVFLASGEPNFLPSTKIVDDLAVESVGVTLVNATDYFWRIDINDTSPSEPNTIVGPVFDFYAGNKAPSVDAGADVYTWLDGGTAQVNLLGTLVDDDGVPVPATVLWTVTSGAATITPPANQLDVTVSMTALGDYDLTLTADDTELTDSDTVTIHVYDDSCEAAKGAGIATLAGDFDENCIVDIADFAVFAGNWLQDISL